MKFEINNTIKSRIRAYSISAIRFILLFGVVFTILYSIINYPVIKINFQYFWSNITNHEQTKSEQKYLPKVKNVKQPTAKELKLANNHIIIKKLNMDVPIVWDSPEDKFLDNLQYGVAHFKGTAKPGEKGNIFIAGHSSSYWWQRGAYSAIFSIIDRLNQGDEVIITYQNKVYVYEVKEKFVVKPSQVEVMKSTETPTLTLMTCTPIGTALNRLIIRANQIIP